MRYKQGDWLDVELVNDLPDQETTIHWHGLRLPNAMDGVPYLTQAPVPPGESFNYRFQLTDAGTYWYHPHFKSSEQVGRGLSGILIVEEDEPPQVDRDLLWALDDWRLTEEAQIHPSFGNGHDASHGGRLGNTVTLNGQIPEKVEVAAGERIRLRLANLSNARNMGLTFEGHDPVVIAVDGQPCAPHRPESGMVVLGAGGRCDVIIDMVGQPGEWFAVRDDYYPQRGYRLLDLVYGEGTINRLVALDPPARLPSNPLPEPDLTSASDHELILRGGAMSGLSGGILNGRQLDVQQLVTAGRFWTINDIAFGAYGQDPLFRFGLGQSQRITIRNETAFAHPMHLHGHHMKLISRNGVAWPHETWHDTLLVEPDEEAVVAFVADNPGSWMFHCHVLEHQSSGMMAVAQVA